VRRQEDRNSRRSDHRLLATASQLTRLTNQPAGVASRRVASQHRSVASRPASWLRFLLPSLSCFVTRRWPDAHRFAVRLFIAVFLFLFFFACVPTLCVWCWTPVSFTAARPRFLRTSQYYCHDRAYPSIPLHPRSACRWRRWSGGDVMSRLLVYCFFQARVHSSFCVVTHHSEQLRSAPCAFF